MWIRFLAVEQDAAGSGDGQFTVSRAIDQLLDDRIVFRGRGDVCAVLQQRQRAAADEVHLETEEVVLSARGLLDRRRRRVHIEQPAEKAADVRRHRDQQVRELDRWSRRVRRLTIRVPLAPQLRVGRGRFLAEPVVQRSQALGLVQIGKGVTGYA